ncbi:protein TE25 [Testudinid alphaherpesvirus 3]|uniref:Protein TE25 n=1 Tax=Testudinid alphaherpesvirus 3 TaxID=2560801 RepID=A0A0M3WMB5_9ALPH|nr:protein TE25 [Testudinid alphaherpesvirus 3]AIU39407.1 protein TE25 [Testudinid alphaherpesvirus 3]AKI81680.1 protein TE25 [Testudinid alphaherpesvirus 3]AKI81683.1 protein TE25 [Testudinid alphaherpesvirus 3]AKI81783.1 protein TE25 [Testudinid alphaherpesvirus 3]
MKVSVLLCASLVFLITSVRSYNHPTNVRRNDAYYCQYSFRELLREFVQTGLEDSWWFGKYRFDLRNEWPWESATELYDSREGLYFRNPQFSELQQQYKRLDGDTTNCCLRARCQGYPYTVGTMTTIWFYIDQGRAQTWFWGDSRGWSCRSRNTLTDHEYTITNSQNKNEMGKEVKLVKAMLMNRPDHHVWLPCRTVCALYENGAKSKELPCDRFYGAPMDVVVNANGPKKEELVTICPSVRSGRCLQVEGYNVDWAKFVGKECMQSQSAITYSSVRGDRLYAEESCARMNLSPRFEAGGVKDPFDVISGFGSMRPVARSVTVTDTDCFFTNTTHNVNFYSWRGGRAKTDLSKWQGKQYVDHTKTNPSDYYQYRLKVNVTPVGANDSTGVFYCVVSCSRGSRCDARNPIVLYARPFAYSQEQKYTVANVRARYNDRAFSADLQISGWPEIDRYSSSQPDPTKVTLRKASESPGEVTYNVTLFAWPEDRPESLIVRLQNQATGFDQNLSFNPWLYPNSTGALLITSNGSSVTSSNVTCKSLSLQKGTKAYDLLLVNVPNDGVYNESGPLDGDHYNSTWGSELEKQHAKLGQGGSSVYLYGPGCWSAFFAFYSGLGANQSLTWADQFSKPVFQEENLWTDTVVDCNFTSLPGFDFNRDAFAWYFGSRSGNLLVGGIYAGTKQITAPFRGLVDVTANGSLLVYSNFSFANPGRELTCKAWKGSNFTDTEYFYKGALTQTYRPWTMETSENRSAEEVKFDLVLENGTYPIVGSVRMPEACDYTVSYNNVTSEGNVRQEWLVAVQRNSPNCTEGSFEAVSDVERFRRKLLVYQDYAASFEVYYHENRSTEFEFLATDGTEPCNASVTLINETDGCYPISNATERGETSYGTYDFSLNATFFANESDCRAVLSFDTRWSNFTFEVDLFNNGSRVWGRYGLDDYDESTDIPVAAPVLIDEA